MINRRSSRKRMVDKNLRFEDLERRELLAADFPAIDGTENNEENADWGSVGQALERWTQVEYTAGISEPAGQDRLSAREVSNIVVASPGDISNEDGLSDLSWVFGQFIDHDIDLSGSGDEPFDIEVPAGDAWFDSTGSGTATIGLNRTQTIEGDDGEVRQQFNEITAFIDGSVIYGSDQDRADALRTFEFGMMATSDGELLPFNDDGFANAGGTSETLFLAGDVRANENAALTAMHTLWVREHNRIAGEIAAANPSLSDESIYQRARQVVIAELQAITYNEFLPALLGDGAIAEYTGYDSSVNPNIANGSSLGMTASTIIAEQFTRLRDGDRFYYENVFSGEMLQRIDNMTLAEVIERNTTIHYTSEANVFFTSDAGISNGLVDEFVNLPSSNDPPPPNGPLPPAGDFADARLPRGPAPIDPSTPPVEPAQPTRPSASRPLATGPLAMGANEAVTDIAFAELDGESDRPRRQI